MSTSLQDFGPDDVFDRIRPLDQEVVGYIGITEEGLFVPFDLLHRPAGPAEELEDAEGPLM